jgi:hypothetical protein
MPSGLDSSITTWLIFFPCFHHFFPAPARYTSGCVFRAVFPADYLDACIPAYGTDHVEGFAEAPFYTESYCRISREDHSSMIARCRPLKKADHSRSAFSLKNKSEVIRAFPATPCRNWTKQIR